MKDRPILFSGPMVRAILDGRKTQTRRVVKARRDGGVICGPAGDGRSAIESWGGGQWNSSSHIECSPCPHGQPGDRLWVRETFRFDGIDHSYGVRERILDHLVYREDLCGDRMQDDCPWKPSIHMPRWASRITLEITGVQVERLQEITEEDSKAEGIHKPAGSQFWYADPSENVLPAITPVGGFWNLWNSINGRPKLPHNTSSRRYARIKRWLERHPDKSWDANPWVWVIEFRRVE